MATAQPVVAADITSLVTTQVMERIEERLDKREGRSFRFMTIVGALVAFVGYAGVSELIDNAATKATANAMLQGRVDLELPHALASAQVAAFEVRQRGQLSEPARVAVMSSLERIAALQRPETELVERDNFMKLLEQAIDLMADAGRLGHVDRLFDLFPNACLQSEGITKSLIRHYGRQAAVGTADRRAAARERFARVERTASSNGVAQLALVHRLLIEFSSQGGETQRLLDAYQELGQDGRQYADGYLHDYLVGKWDGSQFSELRGPLTTLAHELKTRHKLDF